MKDFITYLTNYFRRLTLTSILSTILFISVLIVCNYSFGIESRIRDIRPWYLSLFSFFFFYGFVFYFAWGLTGIPVIQPPAGRRHFLLILLLAPLYFSFKMIHWDLSPLLPDGLQEPWDRYTMIVLQLPAKLLLLCIFLRIISTPAGVGLTTKNFRPGPYFILLALMLPLIALASTRPDFLNTYPKVKNIAFIAGHTRLTWPWQLLYEISYGLDFFSIELFFRGLLVITLARYAGEKARASSGLLRHGPPRPEPSQDSVLPMAAFYCTIHFGKPLGECISSFFGGLILGVIALRTRSILGGLIVHLGLAWLMELGGWLGNLFRL